MNPDLSNDPLPDYLRMFAAQLGITTTNPECIRLAIADLKSQHKTDSESLRAIADQLDLDRFDGKQVALKIGELQNQGKSEARINPLGDLHKRLAIALNLGNVFGDDDVLEAIANLKHSLQLSQNEVKELQEKVAGQWNRIVTLEDESRSLRNHPLPQRNLITQIEALKAELEAIANQLGFNTFHSGQISDWIKNLQEKALMIDNTDIGELRSERDYYRGILDKLCDRLNAPDIEALEHITKSQEMSLDFVGQHNDELREQLAESQAQSLKYMSRIVELEREVQEHKRVIYCLKDDLQVRIDAEAERLSKETIPDSDRFMKGNTISIGEVLGYRRKLQNIEAPPDSDRLSNSELIQIIRSLLK